MERGLVNKLPAPGKMYHVDGERERERERESDCGCGDVQTRLTSCKSRSGVALCGGFALEVLDGNASFQRGRPWGCQGAGGRSIT